MKYAVAGKDIPQEQELFNKLWAMLKRYYLITTDNESDMYWERLVDEAGELYKTIPPNTPFTKFAKDMILGELEYLENLSKQRKHDTHDKHNKQYM